MMVMIFDVGGTEIKYSVMDDAMNRYESGSVPTPSDSQPHFLETMAQLYRPHRDEVDGIALSLPGFIASSMTEYLISVPPTSKIMTFMLVSSRFRFFLLWQKIGYK